MTAIRVLALEDSEEDYLLLLRQLKQAGYAPDSVRIDTQKSLEAALDREWDIVLSDFEMTGFNGMKALSIIRGRGMDIPFILLSGTIGEEIAVEAMKAGAQDYIMKNNSTRLIPAMKRELEEATRRRQGRAALKEREEMLMQAQRMEAIGLLAGGLAHDFNNILGVIGFQVESILESPQDNQVVRASADGIMGALDRANALVRKLLALGRKQVAEPRRASLNQLIGACEAMLRIAVGTRNELEFDLEPGLPEIFADPVQIEQILMNLAVNARDAMSGGGKLLIRTARGLDPENGRELICLSVKDNGCGMEAAVRKRVFEPYFTTKGADKGTGLGLSTVFGIVKQLGGEITVQSEVGVGTAFEISIPPIG